ncbi:hypothetical protein H2201_001478 [Coniosporium apollinis]|uniref:Cupin 2 conserved barrel domain-containing protein n=1 Tax=Coniosporium apollinis TaxID=61459 RepID=A0ABQ9P1E2_9PEZI|nr:hypothetical protein H2201_001478 [Coniosporium apollinis]
MAPSNPETYYFTPTPHVPNSPLPVLIYRAVLPTNPDPESTRETIEPNRWIQGGVFKTYTAHHFHSVTHECYAVFKGKSTLLLGRGPLDQREGGVEVELGVGDIIVLPGSPHWDNNFCKADEKETQEKARNARNVPIPEFDPIYGKGGPLVRIWGDAAAAAAAAA